MRSDIRVDTLIKHLKQQGPNERVERQAGVGLWGVLYESLWAKKSSDFFDASRCNRPRDERETDCRHGDYLGTKILIILPDRRQAANPLANSTINFSLRVLVSSSISLQRPSNHLSLYLTPLSLFISTMSNRYHPTSLSFRPQCSSTLSVTLT